MTVSLLPVKIYTRWLARLAIESISPARAVALANRARCSAFGAVCGVSGRMQRLIALCSMASSATKAAARNDSAQRYGPPATIPTPQNRDECARCNCTLMNAPDDNPEIEL